MIFKDQDDCSKRLLCELNAMRKEGKVGIKVLKKESQMGGGKCSVGNVKNQGPKYSLSRCDAIFVTFRS